MVYFAVAIGKRMRVVEDQACILEADFVFLQIATVFDLIPFKAFSAYLPFRTYIIPRHWLRQNMEMRGERNAQPRWDACHHFRVSFTRAKGFIPPFSSESIRHSQLPASG